MAELTADAHADGTETRLGPVGQMAQQGAQSIQQLEQGATGMFASTGDADGTQSGDDINIGVGELQECTITKSMDSVSHDVFDFTTSDAGDTGTASIDTFSKTFAITVTPTSGDAFDFTAMGDSEAAGSRVGSVKVFICPSDVALLNGDGIDDLATYQPDTAIIGPGESYTYTLDPREVGVGPGESYTYTLDPREVGVGLGEPFTFTLDPREVGAIIMEYAVML